MLRCNHCREIANGLEPPCPDLKDRIGQSGAKHDQRFHLKLIAPRPDDEQNPSHPHTDRQDPMKFNALSQKERQQRNQQQCHKIDTTVDRGKLPSGMKKSAIADEAMARPKNSQNTRAERPSMLFMPLEKMPTRMRRMPRTTTISASGRLALISLIKAHSVLMLIPKANRPGNQRLLHPCAHRSPHLVCVLSLQFSLIRKNRGYKAQSGLPF